MFNNLYKTNLNEALTIDQQAEEQSTSSEDNSLYELTNWVNTKEVIYRVSLLPNNKKQEAKALVNPLLNSKRHTIASSASISNFGLLSNNVKTKAEQFDINKISCEVYKKHKDFLPESTEESMEFKKQFDEIKKKQEDKRQSKRKSKLEIINYKSFDKMFEKLEDQDALIQLKEKPRRSEIILDSTLLNCKFNKETLNNINNNNNNLRLGESLTKNSHLGLGKDNRIVEEFSKEMISVIDDSYTDLKTNEGIDPDPGPSVPSEEDKDADKNHLEKENNTKKLTKEHANTIHETRGKNNIISQKSEEKAEESSLISSRFKSSPEKPLKAKASLLSSLFDSSQKESNLRVVIKENTVCGGTSVNNSNNNKKFSGNSNNSLKGKQKNCIANSSNLDAQHSNNNANNDKVFNKYRKNSQNQESTSEKEQLSNIADNNSNSNYYRLDSIYSRSNNNNNNNTSKIVASESTLNNFNDQSDLLASSTNKLDSVDMSLKPSTKTVINFKHMKSRGSQLEWSKICSEKRSSNQTTSKKEKEKGFKNLKSLPSGSTCNTTSTFVQSNVGVFGNESIILEKGESACSLSINKSNNSYSKTSNYENTSMTFGINNSISNNSNNHSNSNVNSSNISNQSGSKASSLNNKITNKHMPKEINIVDIITMKDPRTTVMIRHIPNKYTLEDLVYEIDAMFYGKYTYINLPLDYSVSFL